MCGLILLGVLSHRVRASGWYPGSPAPTLAAPLMHRGLVGSARGSFVGRWHQESSMSPKWPLLIQQHPAALRLAPPESIPSKNPVALAEVPRGVWAKQHGSLQWQVLPVTSAV